jgi:phage antirepressor YoqD-like protein
MNGGKQMNEIMNIQGIPCYEKDGVAYLNLETVARGLGFTKKADSGNEVVNWTRVRGYLTDLGVEQKCTTGDYIPENIFYRLAMKAKNETAERFQAMIADEVVPAIRKTGGYIAGEAQMTDEELLARALTMASEKLKQRDARIAELAVQNSELTVQKQIMQPKADYFDELVDRNLLTNFRETAKEMKIKEKAFVGFLLGHKYVYRDKRGKLVPYAEKNNGLFELKECVNEKTGWGGTQTLITPKGRETFRLLMQGI